MEVEQGDEVGSAATPSCEVAPMLKAQVVDEILRRLGRGEAVKRLALEYGVDRKTIRAWRARAGYQPRAPRVRVSILTPHADWLTARAAEVEYNSAVLYRELVERGYTGSAQQVLRFVRPLRVAARQPAWDDPVRDGARTAGAGRLRAAARLDRRPARDRTRVRLHARVLPADVSPGVPPRARQPPLAPSLPITPEGIADELPMAALGGGGETAATHDSAPPRAERACQSRGPVVWSAGYR